MPDDAEEADDDDAAKEGAEGVGGGPSCHQTIANSHSHFNKLIHWRDILAHAGNMGAMEWCQIVMVDGLSFSTVVCKLATTSC